LGEINEHSAAIFAELRAADPEFAPFEGLFLPSQRKRSFLTPDEGTALDKKLEQFMLLLSGYFDSS
ncbi:unnamed protein product, partial [Amoebophrya sp. A25]